MNRRGPNTLPYGNTRDDWDPLTSSTINHPLLSACGWRGTPTNEQHTANYTKRLQFK